MKRGYAQAIGAFVIFATGALAGHYVLPETLIPKGVSDTDIQQQNSGYTYINPLLFCSDQAISNYTNKLPHEIEQKITNYLETAKIQGNLTEASVYYKDLNDGPWVLVNGNMRTVPASLLKVPVALTIFKHAEKDNTFFDKKFTLQTAGDANKGQYFVPASAIKPNAPYSVKQLVEYMLEDSDNGALYLLGSTLPEEEFVNSYKDLGIDPPTEVAPGYTMNVRTYASFFRVLFNASYLSRENSEQMLATLAQSRFPQGLEAGLPKDIVVAHKFGEFESEGNDRRLHDCGIVYRPHDPYILCVMTRGTNFEKLAAIISTVSSTVWEVLETQK
jgi:beta-lactamase class A